MSIYDPNNPFGMMPEIPSEHMKEMSDEDLHLIGCMTPLATMVIMAVVFVVCVLIAWIF